MELDMLQLMNTMDWGSKVGIIALISSFGVLFAVLITLSLKYQKGKGKKKE